MSKVFKCLVLLKTQRYSVIDITQGKATKPHTEEGETRGSLTVCTFIVKKNGNGI